MTLAANIKKLYKDICFPVKNAKTAYNIWSSTYDEQPGNLMLDLDEKIVSGFLAQLDLEDKLIADIGCGTGRHWTKLYAKHPFQITGYDVSEGMLQKLKQKYPEAVTHLIKDDLLPDVPDASCDLLISTLTIAHIKNIESAINTWCRLVKKNGGVILTDFHPGALASGAKRTFVHDERSLTVKNYIHSLDRIKELFYVNDFVCHDEKEIVIDETVKHYYEQQNALHVYNTFKGTPVIFGMHLKRGNGTE